jgi:small-conductance mechanosensitive channel
MLTLFPLNTVLLLVAAMVATGGATWFVLTRHWPNREGDPHRQRTWRVGLALVLGAWLLGPLLYALNPATLAPLPIPTILTFLVLGLIAGTVPLLLSARFRQVVRATPPALFVGVHLIRLVGFAFLALMDMGLLPAQFALGAGYGDIAVAVLALGVIYLLLRQHPSARPLAIGWNVLGLLDFVGALVTGVLFIEPFALQLAASGLSLAYVNYVLIIPSFGVPLYTLLHIYSLYQLLATPQPATDDAHEPLAARQYA